LPDAADPKAKAADRRAELQARLRQTQQKRQQLVEALIPAAVRTELASTESRLAALEKEITDVQTASKVYSVLSIPPRPIHRLHRGDVEKPKELVGPGALSLLPGLPGE